MAPNNETVSRQMPWAGNIAKTMTSNGKQFTVTREMFTAVARDRWNLSAVFKFCFCFVLLYNKLLNDWSLGEQWISFRETLRFSINKIHRSPRDQSLSVIYYTLCVYISVIKPWLKMIPVKWYDIISLQLSNQIDCDNLVGPIRLQVLF